MMYIMYIHMNVSFVLNNIDDDQIERKNYFRVKLAGLQLNDP